MVLIFNNYLEKCAVLNPKIDYQNQKIKYMIYETFYDYSVPPNMPSNTSSKSSIKTRESKTSNSSFKGSSHSSKKSEQKEPSKVTSSSKSKPEQKESTKAGSVPKSSTSSKNVKNDLVNKNSVNVSKSRSSSLSNKSSKISSSSNASSEKKSSSTSKSSPRKSTLESSGGRKHESLRRKEQRSSNKDEDSKSEEKKKLLPSKDLARRVQKTSSKSGSHSPRKSSKDDSKNKKHEEKIKTEKESKAKKIDEKTKKTKAENVDKNKTEKIEKTKPKKSEKSKPEKIERIKSEKIEKTKAEKSAKTKPEKIEEAKSEKIEETKTEKTAKTKEEKIEEAKPEKIEKTEEMEKFINNEYSSVKEKGEIDRMEKPIVMENDKEIIGRDAPEVITTTINPNDNSLETLESGISITTPNELSDGEVEESISSRFVEVDEMEYPSPPSSSINLHSSSQNPRNDSKLEEEEEEEEEEKGIKEDNMYMDYEEDFEASEKMKNRGQILLEMIQLDTISIDLFIQVSDSYESYIAAFGTTNTLQTSTQTNDDAISEEVQTESPPLLNKWTQKPINISVKDDYLPTAEDFLGVGGDSAQDDDEENTHATFKSLSVDSEHLTKFLSASTQVVLMLLEEDSVFKNDSLGSDDDEDLGFSKTGIVLGNGMNSLLKGRKATFVSFCSSDPLMIVTGHDFQDLNNNATGFISKENRKNSESEVENEEGLETQNEEQKSEEEPSNESFSENGAFLCIWSIRQPSFPQRILCCHSSPKVACFSPGRPIALVAGLTDGSLAAWDFRESLANHPVTVSFGDDKKWRLSPPSYITACHKEGFIGGSEIVAIEAVGKPEEHSSNFGSFQVVSLSASGQLTWWVIVQGEMQPMKMTDLNSTGILTEHGAAPWSRIIISRAASLSVEDMLPQSEDDFPGSNLCYDLKLSSSDSNQIYVAIANGRVLHCSRHSIKLHPSSFIPEIVSYLGLECRDIYPIVSVEKGEIVDGELTDFNND
ncbi:WD repeat-containing protein 60 [Armadillidium vulgare]|nr:WD repeat-containing protein 60 [Armadillidium vulgare]